MSLCVIDRAENYMCDSWEPGDSINEDRVWEWILDAAYEDERCTDGDGEWLEGFPEALEDPDTEIGAEADEANREALSFMEECRSEYNSEHGSLSRWELNS